MSDNSISTFSAKKAPVAKPSSPLSSLASTNPKKLKDNYCLGIIPAVNNAHPQSKAPRSPSQIDLQDQLPQCWGLLILTLTIQKGQVLKLYLLSRLLQRWLSKLTEWRSVDLRKKDGKLCQTSTTSLNNLSGDNDKMKYISNWTTFTKISLYEHFNQKILVVITKLSTS